MFVACRRAYELYEGCRRSPLERMRIRYYTRAVKVVGRDHDHDDDDEDDGDEDDNDEADLDPR
eukprot:1331783-Pyramimonas_sp.AAC.1